MQNSACGRVFFFFFFFFVEIEQKQAISLLINFLFIELLHKINITFVG